jgi:chromosomal replication initiator protein
MYEVTVEQSQAITNALLEAQIKIEAITKMPCKVLLTSPRIVLAHTQMSEYVNAVFAAIEKHTGINAGAIISQSREQPIVRARHIAYKIIHESPYQPSYKQMGRLFHRDHSSIIHGVQTINNDIEKIEAYRSLYLTILKELNTKQ